MKKGLVKLGLGLGLSFLTLTTSVLAVEDEPTELDTLILYSQGAADQYGEDIESRIEHLVTTTNTIYTDSGVNVKLNPVKIQQYEMDDTAHSGDVLYAIRTDADVAELRDSVGADNVVMFRPYAGDSVCGVAYLNKYINNPSATWTDKYMYAHVSIDCGGYVTAHEVGHNAGLGHSAEQNSTGIYEYARGHGVHNNFVTVMAYSGSYNASRVNMHSSPNLECNGLPCGVEEGEEDAADAVKALKETLPIMATYREHVEQPDNNDTDDNGTNDGAEQLAAALKAYTDQQAKVADLKTELLGLRDVFKEKRAEYLEIRTEYKAQRATFYEKRTEYRSLRADYRALVTAYRAERNKYRAGTISRDAFLAIRAKFIVDRVAVRAIYQKYYNDVYKPAHLALKTYRDTIRKPAYNVYKEAVSAYRDFYTNTYKVEKARLVELEKIYLDLKNLYG